MDAALINTLIAGPTAALGITLYLLLSDRTAHREERKQLLQAHKEERESLLADLKQERERGDEFGKAIIEGMTEANIHLANVPEVNKIVTEKISDEHQTTRQTIIDKTKQLLIDEGTG